MRVERAAATAFLGAFLLAPIGYLVSRALAPSFSDLGSFVAILAGNPRSLEITLNSLNLALITSGLSLLIGIPFAVLLARYDFPGKRLVGPLLLLPLILPPFVGAIGMRRLLSRFGPVNLVLLDLGIVSAPPDWLGGAALLGTAVLQTLHLFPIVTLNTMSSALALDDTLEESARLCGASPWTVFRRVTLPLLAPGATAGASIVFIWSLTDLGTPLMFNLRDLLAVEIYQLSDELYGNPLGYLLVSFVLVLSSTIFALTRSAAASGSRFSLTKGGGRRLRRKLGPLSAAFALLFVSVLLVAALAPHLMVVLLACTGSWFMTPLPETYTASHFLELGSHPLTVRSLRNSLVLAIGSTLVDLVLGAVFASWAVRARGITRRTLDTLLMLPLAVPGIVLAFGYLALYRDTPLDPKVDPFPLLVIGYGIRRLPFMVRTLTTGLEQLDPALEEAAKVCGAGRGAILRRITIPLVLPSVLAGTLLCFVFALLEVSESLLLASEERHYPITKALYALLVRPDGVYLASALGAASTVVLALAFMAARKLLGERAGEVLGR
jgi:iron(III) transport system permease protein